MRKSTKLNFMYILVVIPIYFFFYNIYKSFSTAWIYFYRCK